MRRWAAHPHGRRWPHTASQRHPDPGPSALPLGAHPEEARPQAPQGVCAWTSVFIFVLIRVSMSALS